jgi:hypothetical protein
MSGVRCGAQVSSHGEAPRALVKLQQLYHNDEKKYEAAGRATHSAAAGASRGGVRRATRPLPTGRSAGEIAAPAAFNFGAGGSPLRNPWRKVLRAICGASVLCPPPVILARVGRPDGIPGARCSVQSVARACCAHRRSFWRKSECASGKRLVDLNQISI